MVVAYGRRRIGKTTLISQKVYSFFDMPVSTGVFVGWNEAFEFLAEKANERRFVLVFDEFPYADGAKAHRQRAPYKKD